MDDTTRNDQHDRQDSSNRSAEPQSPESMTTLEEGGAAVAQEDDGSVGRNGDDHEHAAAPRSPPRPQSSVDSNEPAACPAQQQQQAFAVLSHGQGPSRPTPTYPPDYTNRLASSSSSTQPYHLAGPLTIPRSLDIPVATASSMPSHATSATRFTSTEPESYPLAASSEAQFQSLQAYYQDRPILAQTTFQASYSTYPHPPARPRTNSPPVHRSSLGYMPPPPAPGAMQYLNAPPYPRHSSASSGIGGPGIGRTIYSHGSTDGGGPASRPATADSGASGVEKGASSLMDLRGECEVRKVNPVRGKEGESAQSDGSGGRKRASYEMNEDHEGGDADEGGPPPSRRRVDPPPASQAPPPAGSLGWVNTYPAGAIYVPATGSSAYYVQQQQPHVGANTQYRQAHSHVPVYQPYVVAPPPGQHAHHRKSSDEADHSDQEEFQRDEAPCSPASASTVVARSGEGTSPATSYHSAPRPILPLPDQEPKVSLVSPSGSGGFVASPTGEDDQREGQGEELGKGKKGKAKGEKKGRAQAPINSYHIESISGVKPFIAKLRYMLANPQEFSDVICWSDDGQSVLVKTGGKSRMADDLLPRVFNHSNIASLTRQFTAYGFQSLKDTTLALALSHTAPQAQFSASTSTYVFPSTPWSATQPAPAPRRRPEEWRAYIHVHTDDDFVAALEDKKAASKKREEVASDGEGDAQDVANWFTRDTIADIAVMKRLKAKPKGRSGSGSGSGSGSTGGSGGAKGKKGKAQQVQPEQETVGDLTVDDSEHRHSSSPQLLQQDSPYSILGEQQQLPQGGRRIIGGVQVPMEGLLRGVGGPRQPQPSPGGSLH
ncbi:hypothetical protein JCM1840_001415 [Sporobolomyces johnsonii]